MSRVTPGSPGNFSSGGGGGSSSTITNLVGITALGQATMANSLPVVLSSNQSAIPVSQSGTWNISTVTAVTAISNALPAGTNNIGDVDVLTVPADPFGANADAAVAAGATGSIQAKLRRATQGLEDLKSLIVLAAGTNLVGDVGIQPRTTNGLDTFMASGSDGSSILVATAQAVKASAGKVYGYYLYNPEAAVTFVHFYNTASGSVTVGTTNPLFTLQIPAGAGANLMSEIGVAFGTAITIAATTTAGGNTAPSTGVSATIWYK